MANQIVISSGAKVRNLSGVLTGTAGVVDALGINVANGIPQLDGSGKILVSQLPNSVMEYKGTWNAATNTPTLVNGTGNQGDVYLCNVAGTVNFGAGAITFAVGDQAIYSGTIWQKAGGATGTVTSVAITETGDALTITGSPITTSGTINIGFAGVSGQYVNGAGGLTTFPSLAGYITAVTGTAPVVSSGGTTPAISMPVATASVDGYLDNADWTTFNNKQNAITLTTTGTSGAATLIGATLNIPNYSTALSGYVPYTGATQDVDLGAFKLNAQSLHAKGTGGLGHLGLKHQSASATASANEVSLFADSLGDLSWQNGNLYLSKFITSGNTAARSYTFPNASGTVALTSDLSSYVPYSGATANVDLGAFNLTSTNLISKQLTINTTSNYGGSIILESGSLGITGSATNGITLAANSNTVFRITSVIGGSQFRFAQFNLASLGNGQTRTYTLPDADGTVALTSNLSAYLPLTGGTLTGALNINLGSGTGLNVASDLVIFRASTGFATPRQITLAAGNGATTYLEAKGYGANYITDFGIRTYNSSGTAFEVFFATSAGDVGIGNTAPSYKLDVSGTGRFGGNATYNGFLIGSHSNNVGAAIYNKGLANATLYSDSASTVLNAETNLFLRTGNTDRLTIASSGAATFSNVVKIGAGLNVTGYTNSSGANNWEIGSDASGYYMNALNRSSGNYNQPAYIDAQKLIINSGSGGDIGIGTTTPLQPAANRTVTTINGTSSAILNLATGNTLRTYLYVDSSGSTFETAGTNTISASGANLINFNTNGSERARITSAGDVCVATTAPYVNTTGRGNITIGGSSSSILAFQIGGTGKSYIYHNSTDWVLQNNSGGTIYVQGTSGGVYLSNGATSWTANSDERLKNINNNINNAVEKLMTLRAVNFSWKSDKTNKENLGLIAQEVEKVFPQVIDKNKLNNGVDKKLDETEYLGVRYQDLVPVLVKAIQEQQSQIEELKAKIK